MAEEKGGAPAADVASPKTTVGKSSKELINTVSPVVPTKGSNAGKQMYIINGKHWSTVEPKATDTHVDLQEAIVPEKGTYLNVIGFSSDTRMTMADKIKVLTSVDAGYSMALASLLKGN